MYEGTIKTDCPRWAGNSFGNLDNSQYNLDYARPVYWDFKYNLFLRIFNFFLIACVLNGPLSFFFP